MMWIVTTIVRGIRKTILSLELRKKWVELHRPFDWANPKNVIIASSVYIGPASKFWGKGRVSIGFNTIIGPNLTVMTSSHDYRTGGFLPYGFEDRIGDVIIKEHVWIGANVCILPGVTLGEGAIVGMGSVVTKSVPPCTIVGGNPAHTIGIRDKDEYERLKEEKRYYLCEKAARSQRPTR